MKVSVGVGVGDGVCVAVGVGVAVAVGVEVDVTVAVPVAVPVAVGGDVGPGVKVSVGVGVYVSLGVGVTEGVKVNGITPSGFTFGGTIITPGVPLAGGVTMTTSRRTVAVAVNVGNNDRVASTVGCGRLTKLVAEQPRLRINSTKNARSGWFSASLRFPMGG